MSLKKAELLIYNIKVGEEFNLAFVPLNGDIIREVAFFLPGYTCTPLGVLIFWEQIINYQELYLTPLSSYQNFEKNQNISSLNSNNFLQNTPRLTSTLT